MCTSCLPSDIYVTVQYQVTFPSPASCPIAKGATPPPSYPVTIAVPSGSTVLDVMQQAVGIDGQTQSAFKFSATNFGPQLGFFIDAIGGTSAINNGSSGCYWELLYSYLNNPLTSSNVGASHFSICCNGYSIVWQYTAY
eukprot:Em0001g461a